MLIEKAYLNLAMPETLKNSLIESESMSLATKKSRLLCIGVRGVLLFDLFCLGVEQYQELGAQKGQYFPVLQKNQDQIG